MRPEDLDLLALCGVPAMHPSGSLSVVSVVRPDLASNSYVGGLWLVPLDDSGPPVRLTRGFRDTAPAISPDGRMVAFLRAEPKNGKPQVHVLELGAADPVVLTDSPLGAGVPVWSPDSRRIAFVARLPEPGRYGTDDDIPAEGEAPRLITRLDYRADGLGYSNDRRSHLFVLDVPDLEFDLVPTGESLPEARQITDGDCDDTDVTWSPDGLRLAFVSGRDEVGMPRSYEGLTSPIFSCAPDGSDLVLLGGTGLACKGPKWTADGEQLVFLAEELGANGRDFVARNMGLYVVPAGNERAAGEAADPTPDPKADPAPDKAALSSGRDDASIGSGRPDVSHVRLTDAETIDLGEVGTHLSVSERGVLVQDRRRGTVRVLEIDPRGDPVDAGSASEVAAGNAWHTGHAVTPAGDTVVASMVGPDAPSELVLIRGGPGPAEALPRRLTDLSRRLRDVAPPRPILEQEISGQDGYPVHGWAVLPDPDRYGPGPYPVLLNIHGGPYASYASTFFDEPQVYAGAGYAVLICNPRGSAGYGQAHGLAIKGAMGGVDTEDILAFLDGCLADSGLHLDAGRVGVMGGSYGGYMTAWLTTRTDRFTAAIVERGYLDAVSFVGSSDIGWFFSDEYHGGRFATGNGDACGDLPAASPADDPADDPTDDPADDPLRDQTPMAFVDRVTTPTLVIHSEQDWRTPIEQGQRWFTALRRNGVPAKLLVFPGEGHELSRSGSPTHRRDRFTHILDWWAEHLRA